MIDLAASHSAEIVHHVPGRLRLKVPRGRDNPAILEQIKTAFGHVPNVDSVETRVASGSVVVLYDPEHYGDIAALVRGLARTEAKSGATNGSAGPAAAPGKKRSTKPRLPESAQPHPSEEHPPGHPLHKPPKTHLNEELEGIEQEAEFLAEHSHTARVLVDWCKELDNQIKRVSNNNLDLKIMVPLGLAAVTFLEIGAAAATPMWVTLAIFSLNHFVELHAHENDDDNEDEDEDEGQKSKQGSDEQAGAPQLS
jgi:hypothetical protein